MAKNNYMIPQTTREHHPLFIMGQNNNLGPKDNLGPVSELRQPEKDYPSSVYAGPASVTTDDPKSGQALPAGSGLETSTAIETTEEKADMHWGNGENSEFEALPAMFTETQADVLAAHARILNTIGGIEGIRTNMNNEGILAQSFSLCKLNSLLPKTYKTVRKSLTINDKELDDLYYLAQVVAAGNNLQRFIIEHSAEMGVAIHYYDEQRYWPQHRLLLAAMGLLLGQYISASEKTKKEELAQLIAFALIFYKANYDEDLNLEFPLERNAVNLSNLALNLIHTASVYTNILADTDFF